MCAGLDPHLHADQGTVVGAFHRREIVAGEIARGRYAIIGDRQCRERRPFVVAGLFSRPKSAALDLRDGNLAVVESH
jgi:hypothetical protein